jgi:hypothetical protein
MSRGELSQNDSSSPSDASHAACPTYPATSNVHSERERKREEREGEREREKEREKERKREREREKECLHTLGQGDSECWRECLSIFT